MIDDNLWPNLVDYDNWPRPSGVSWTSPRITMTAHDDAISLQHAINARAAFPESRRMLALDHALDRLTDGPRRVERLIVGTFATGCAVMWLGWRLGRR